MYTIELTADELGLVRVALISYLDELGHEEAQVIEATRNLLTKLPVMPGATV